MKGTIFKLAVAITLSVFSITGQASDAKVFRFASALDVETLDPHGTSGTESSQLLSNVYEGLTYFVPGGSVQPSLALSWEKVSPKVWRFHLRQDVKFHNGQKFDANDVLFSYERARADGSRVRYAVQSIEEMKVIDEYTVDLHLVAENSGITRELNTFFIMSKPWAVDHQLESAKRSVSSAESHTTLHANGTGPFKLKSRTPGSSIVLVPNDGWWGTRKDNLTEVRFTPIPSDSTRVAALLSGQVDMINSVPIQTVSQLRAAANIKVQETVGTRTLFLMMDQGNEVLKESNVKDANPFKDQRVRKAMAIAIDRKALAKNVMFGNATPAVQLVAPTIFGYNKQIDDSYDFNLDEARRLLESAGYPDGFSTTLTCPNNEYPNDAAICQALVPMFARLGIKIELVTQNYTRVYDKVLSGNSSLYMFGWSGSQTMEASSLLVNVFHTASPTHGSYNAIGYSNEKVDSLYQAALSEDDDSLREGLLNNAISILNDDVAGIPLMYLHVVWAMNDRVHMEQDSDNFIHLKDVRIE